MRRKRAVAQLGSALEWGSRGRGFKSRRPERIRSLIVLFHVYILHSGKTGRRLWDRAKILLNIFGGTVCAIPKPPVMARRGLWYTVKAFLVVLNPQKGSDIQIWPWSRRTRVLAFLERSPQRQVAGSNRLGERSGR